MQKATRGFEIELKARWLFEKLARHVKVKEPENIIRIQTLETPVEATAEKPFRKWSRPYLDTKL